MRYIDDWNWFERKLLVLDIETTMDWKEIRLVGVWLDGLSKRYFTDLDAFAEWLDDWYCDDITIVTWNGVRFDFPRLDDASWRVGEILDKYHHIDLMILDKLEQHDRFGGHSMANVAKQELGEEDQKMTIDYDNAPLEDLQVYLEKDLDITRKLADKLLHHPHTSPLIYNVEHRVAEMVADQVEFEVRYDREKGEKLSTIIGWEMGALEDAIIPHLPFMEVSKSKLHYPPKVQFKADGSLSAYMEKYLDLHDAVYSPSGKSVLYTCPKRGKVMEPVPLTQPINKYKQMTPADLPAIKQHLMSLGWLPTEWNVKKVNGRYEQTSPRLTLKQSGEVCPALLTMGHVWVELLAKWLTLRSRLGVLKGWNEKTEEMSFPTLPSDADSLGANTYRFTHRVIANVPRVSSIHGKTMRELFCARDKRVWVGWDADSLEAKVEAAYVHRYDSDYAEVLCSGDSSKGTDVHSRNLKAIPLLKDRDQAKTLKYAITYGAQPVRISQILGCTLSEAQDIYDGFWASNQALAKVKQDTLDEWKRNSKKFIHAIDGRRIFTRSEHSLLNAKFQSAGAIIMKYAMVICDKQVRKEKLPAVGLIRYHDEEIYESVPSCAGRVLEIGCESVRIAGEKLNLPVPLSASGCLGQNWAEVH